ncbi:MAG: hypothetical protein ACPGO3_01445 [Magnetospiraceae bacterium]
MNDTDLQRINARLTAMEKIVRVSNIQATGDAIDQWFQVAQDAASDADAIEKAGLEAAKEVLNTKNREAHQLEQQGVHLRNA